MPKLCYDAEVPPAEPPATDVVLIYIPGGTAAHGWTEAEIASQSARYRLPCFVQNSPSRANAAADVATVLAWLEAHNVPKGVVVCWDLEGMVAVAYMTAVEAKMHAAGYLVLPYGERSTLFENPRGDGYFDADPNSVEHISPGSVGTQYEWTGPFDLSLFADSVPFWDLQTPPSPEPAPVPAPPAPRLTGGDMSTFSQAPRPDGSGEDVVVVNVDGSISWQGDTPDWELGTFAKLTDRGAAAQPSPARGVSVAWSTPVRMTVRYVDENGRLWLNVLNTDGAAPWTFGAWEQDTKVKILVPFTMTPIPLPAAASQEVPEPSSSEPS